MNQNKVIVARGGTQPFTATVAGTGLYSHEARWSVSDNTDTTGTFINPTAGVLTVSGTETGPLVVTATSKQDTNHSGPVTVDVQ